MTTNVHYFGMIAERLGMSSEMITIDTGNSSIDLRSYFEAKYPDLIDMSYKIAVNQEMTNHILPNIIPTEIALLPPFAGG